MSKIIYYPANILLQHLQTKHINEWQLCEEEKKEHELAKKQKKDDFTQPTLLTVLNRKQEYPSTMIIIMLC